MGACNICSGTNTETEFLVSLNQPTFKFKENPYNVSSLYTDLPLAVKETMEYLSVYPSESLLDPVKLADKSIYVGEWEKNEVKGRGQRFYLDGSYAKGTWSNMNLNGEGLLINADGSYYIGDFKDGEMDGIGEMKKGIYKYEGDWKDNLQHGKGKETWENKMHSEALFYKGRKNGQGKLTVAGLSTYEGNFIDDLPSGTGTCLWEDGRTYNGNWLDGKMNGKGIYVWPDGRCYTGEYTNNQKEGFGTFSWPDGKKYEGYWQRGHQHGIGVYSVNGIQRKGEWKHGQRIRWID